MWLVTMLVTWGAACLQGCLVLDEIDFPLEEPSPSVITDAPSSQLKIGHAARFNRNAPGPNEIAFEVIVTDENITEPLVARLRAISNQLEGPQMLTGCEGETGADVTVVPITGTSSRTLRLPVAKTDFSTPGCYRLELAVSGSFKNTCEEVTLAPAVFTATSPRNDHGLANWWIFVTDGSPDESPAADCPAEDLDALQADTFEG